MIQELLGIVMMEERKISTPGALLASDGSSSSSSSSSLSSSSPSSPSSSSDPKQNLKCPRCDSCNTKFCYYNNYNLTQPRHFCKTCRRYWTKGGALRNVPIGGTCRRPNLSSSPVGGGRSGGGKARPVSNAARPSQLGVGLDNELASSPVMWASPCSSHLLALIRATQFQNPNPSPASNSNINPFGIIDGQYPFFQQQQQQQHNMLLGEVQSSELYQRLRSPANYHHGQSPMLMNNVDSAAACSPSITPATNNVDSILEPISMSGGELGYWNPAFSWPDLPTTNGAFP